MTVLGNEQTRQGRPRTASSTSNPRAGQTARPAVGPEVSSLTSDDRCCGKLYETVSSKRRGGDSHPRPPRLEVSLASPTPWMLTMDIEERGLQQEGKTTHTQRSLVEAISISHSPGSKQSRSQSQCAVWQFGKPGPVVFYVKSEFFT